MQVVLTPSSMSILTNRTFEDYHDAIGDDIVLECTVIHTLMMFVRVKAGEVEREHDVRLVFKSRWNLALMLTQSIYQRASV